MDPLHLTHHIYRSPDPNAAFSAVIDFLLGEMQLNCGLYITAKDRSVRNAWPPEATLSDELVDTALHVLRPEVFPLGSEFPFDAAVYPTADLLILPLHRSTDREAVCLLIGGAGAFGDNPDVWEEVCAAVESFEDRHSRIFEAEQRCIELKRRADESESLHTLGLAANRTLNKDEVLNLVARFTRTLLGAHYVTVNTADTGRIHTVASVGLHDAAASSQDFHLARSVVEAEKHLTVGGAEANLQVANFPFHSGEGMVTGLGIPLSLFGDTFGALIVGYRREYTITPRDIRLGLTLAGHAAVAISNARLHAAVEERSEQLAEAYEELDSLSKAKERFFASINHELRNPLGAILGYLALLLDGAAGELPALQHGYIEKANRAATTLLTLVNDILDLSKIAAGKMEIELQPCSIPSILDGVLNIIQPLADERGVPLRVEVDPDLPDLTTDAARVQQILVNLLSNAVKFADERGVWIRSSVNGRLGDAGDPPQLELRVSDSGPGIGAEDAKRIFEEYEQVKGSKGGTGLGLPISRRLARLLAGDLLVETEIGLGSTFILRLPANLPEEAAPVRAAGGRASLSHPNR